MINNSNKIKPNWDFKGIDQYIISKGKTSNPFSSSVVMPSEAYRVRLRSNRRRQCSVSELDIAISENLGQCRSNGCKKIQMDNTNNEVSSCPVLECAKEVQANLDAQFPSLIKLMLQSHVTRGFWLGLPAEFCKMHLPSNNEIVILEDEIGEEYETRFLASKRGLSRGWSGFAQAHKLLEGDAVVFHLVRSCKFKVYIVRSTSLGEVGGAIALLNLQNHAIGRDSGLGLNKMLRKKEKGGAPKAIEEKKKSAAETVGKMAKRGAPLTKIVEWQPRRKSQRVAVIVDDGQTEKGGASGFELVHFDKQGKSRNSMSSQAPYTVPLSDKCMTIIKEMPEQDKLVEHVAGKFYPYWKLDHNARAQYISHAKKCIDLSVFLRDQEFSAQCSDLEVDKQLCCSSLQTMVFGQELLYQQASSLKCIQEVEEQLVKLNDRVVELESRIEEMQKFEGQLQMKLKDKADEIEKASSERVNTATKLKEVCQKMKRYEEHFRSVQASLKKYETDDGLLNPSIVKDLSLRCLKTPFFRRIMKNILNPCFNAGFTMAVDKMKKSNPDVKLPNDILQKYYEPSAIKSKVPWQKRYALPKDFADDHFEEEEDKEGEDGSDCNDGLITEDIGPVDKSIPAKDTCAQNSMNIYEGASAQGQNELPPATVSNPIDVAHEQFQIVNPTGDWERNESIIAGLAFLKNFLKKYYDPSTRWVLLDWSIPPPPREGQVVEGIEQETKQVK